MKKRIALLPVFVMIGSLTYGYNVDKIISGFNLKFATLSRLIPQILSHQDNVTVQNQKKINSSVETILKKFDDALNSSNSMLLILDKKHKTVSVKKISKGSLADFVKVMENYLSAIFNLALKFEKHTNLLSADDDKKIEELAAITLKSLMSVSIEITTLLTTLQLNATQ